MSRAPDGLLRAGPVARGARAGALAHLACLAATAATGQATPPDEEWRQFSTPHFVVTHPERMEDAARRAAVFAERAYGHLARELPHVPDGPVQLLLTDHADVSNGFATPIPYNRITVFARPPMDGGSLSHFDDWLELVVAHELVHTFHMDMSGPLGGALRKVFGRAPVLWPLFPSASTPTWMIEGLATHYESRLTGAGRIHGVWQDMVMRAAALEDAWPRLDQVTGTTPTWPGGHRPYVYGARYLEHLAERHGPEAMGRLARSLADLWIPYRLNAAARRALGSTVSESWEEWGRAKRAEYRSLARSLAESAPVTEGAVLAEAGRVAGQVAVSPDGARVALFRADGVDAAQIRIFDADGSGERRLARVNGPGASLSWAPDGSLYFTQLEFSDPYRLTGDVYRATPQGEIERVTRGQRLTHVDVAPAGDRAIAVQEGEGTNRLVEVDLGTGAVRALTEPDPELHWAYPRWSPDGTRVAAVRWRAPGFMDVVVVDEEARALFEVTRDRAVDTAPSWTPDASTVIWSSDRTGVANLYAAALDSGGVARVRQVTNVLGGATHPSVDSRGRWIHFASYGADGWRTERIPFDPDRWFPPQPARSDLGVGSADHRDSAAAAPALGDARPYSALPTLRPRAWLPLYAPADVGTDASGRRHDVLGPFVGAAVGGTDLVGRHSYAVRLMASTDGRRLSGAVRYGYGGWVNPAVGLIASQSQDASPRAFEVSTEEGSVGEFFLVERERRALATASFSRRRYRTFAGLTLQGGVVRSDYALQGLQGEPGPTLRLPPPTASFVEAGATASVSNAQFRAMSFSLEDGVRLRLGGRVRRPWGLDEDVRDVLGRHRGFQELTGEASAYKALFRSGFANHVLALRVSAGAAFGAGADQFHYDVGGASGRGIAVPGIGTIGGPSLAFPVRGHSRDARTGRRAWSASAEYRMPLAVADRGWDVLPLFLDRLHAAVFLDAGNAWGPELGRRGYDNPRRSTLVAAGAELGAILGALYQGGISLRLGWGVPLAAAEGSRLYVRAGRAF